MSEWKSYIFQKISYKKKQSKYNCWLYNPKKLTGISKFNAKVSQIVVKMLNQCPSKFIYFFQQGEMETISFEDHIFANKKVKPYIEKIPLKDMSNIAEKIKKNQHLSNDSLTQSQKITVVANQVQFLGYDLDYCMIFGIYAPKIQRVNLQSLNFTIIRIIEESFYLKANERLKSCGYKRYSTEGITLVFFNKMQNIQPKNKKLNFLSKSSPNRNHLASHAIKMQEFKGEIIKNMSLKHLCKINKIIFLFPTMINKSWNFFSFGIDNNFYDLFFEYFDSLYQLRSYLGPLFQISQVDKQVLICDNDRKWKHMFTEQARTKSLNQFMSYEQLCTQTAIIQIARLSPSRYFKYPAQYFTIKKQNQQIPLILELILQSLQQKCTKYEGIFRKVADQYRLYLFESQIFEKQKQINQQMQTNIPIAMEQIVKRQKPQTLTSFLKKMLTQFEKPIIPYFIEKEITSKTLSQLVELQNICIRRVKDQKQSLENKPQQLPLKSRINLEDKKLQNLVNSQKQLKKQQFLQKVAFFEELSIKKNQSQPKDTKQRNIQDSANSHRPIFRKVQQSKHSLVKVRAKKYDLKQGDFLESIIQKTVNRGDFDKENFNVLKRLLMFLNEKILPEQRYNKMSANNLAICFTPCFFKQDNETNLVASLQRNKKLVKILQFLIKNPHRYLSNLQIQNTYNEREK